MLKYYKYLVEGRIVGAALNFIATSFPGPYVFIHSVLEYLNVGLLQPSKDGTRS